MPDIGHVETMRLLVEHDESYQRRCTVNGEKIFYATDTEARMPGHIYSPEGLVEYTISGSCEYHFDELATAWEEDVGRADV